MKRKNSIAGIVAVFVFVTASGAQALSYSGNSATLDAGDAISFGFPQLGNYNSAVFTMEVDKLTGVPFYYPTRSPTISPPTARIVTNLYEPYSYSPRMIFLAPFRLGTNRFDYMIKGNSTTDPSFDLTMLRGSISFSNAKFTVTSKTGSVSTINARLYNGVPHGPVAPEPVSMALMGLGLAGLPFARRLRKMIAA